MREADSAAAGRKLLNKERVAASGSLREGLFFLLLGASSLEFTAKYPKGDLAWSPLTVGK